jgi:hypothetical protein
MYELFQHRHNFFAWAAARAVNRKFTTVENLKDAIEACGVVNFVRHQKNLDIGRKEYCDLHRNWCRQIIVFLNLKGVTGATFGRAAKLIAVYIKGMVVVGGYADSQLAKIADPPIDRIILQNIARDKEVLSSHKSSWRTICWTNLDEADYYDLVDQLLSTLAPGEPFWKLERHWSVISD